MSGPRSLEGTLAGAALAKAQRTRRKADGAHAAALIGHHMNTAYRELPDIEAETAFIRRLSAHLRRHQGFNFAAIDEVLEAGRDTA